MPEPIYAFHDIESGARIIANGEDRDASKRFPSGTKAIRNDIATDLPPGSSLTVM